MTAAIVSARRLINPPAVEAGPRKVADDPSVQATIHRGNSQDSLCSPAWRVAFCATRASEYPSLLKTQTLFQFSAGHRENARPRFTSPKRIGTAHFGADNVKSSHPSQTPMPNGTAEHPGQRTGFPRSSKHPMTNAVDRLKCKGQS